MYSVRPKWISLFSAHFTIKIIEMAEGAINPDDELVVTMLGAGQEVGRSCHLLEFKGKKILLDIGIHPGISGLNGLPFMDYTDPEKIDILLIRNHFWISKSNSK